MKFYPLFDV